MAFFPAYISSSLHSGLFWDNWVCQVQLPFSGKKLVMLGQERIHSNQKTENHRQNLGKFLLVKPDMLSKLSKITSSQPILQTLFIFDCFLPYIIISHRSDSSFFGLYGWLHNASSREEDNHLSFLLLFPTLSKKLVLKKGRKPLH